MVVLMGVRQQRNNNASLIASVGEKIYCNVVFEISLYLALTVHEQYDDDKKPMLYVLNFYQRI